MKWRIIISALIIFILFALILLFVNRVKQNNIYSEKIIENTSQKLNKELLGFFEPKVEAVLSLENTLINAKDNTDMMELHLFQFLESHPQFSTAIVKRGKARDYIFYRDHGTYVASLRRNTTPDDSVYNWKRVRVPGKTENEWNEVLNLNKLNMDWYQGSIREMKNGKMFWEGQYWSNFTKEPVLVAASAFQTSKSDTIALGLEIPVRNLVNAMRSFDWYKERRLFIVGDDQSWIHIPTSMEDSLVRYHNGGATLTTADPVLSMIKNHWEVLGMDPVQTNTFEIKDVKWWIRVDTLTWNTQRTIYGIAVPEEELILGEFRRRIRYILAGLGILIAGLLFLGLRKKSIKRREVRSLLGTEQSDDSDILSLIKKGEHEGLEFKSTLRWDLRMQKVNPVLENVILKTIAAFGNANGGLLIIGVDDEGQIIGLENDCNTFRKSGIDYFEIHLRNLLNSQFGIPFVKSNLNIRFANIQGKDLAIIHVLPSDTPIYIILQDKSGIQREKFFVRSGNSSQEIKSLKELNLYIQHRFSD